MHELSAIPISAWQSLFVR